MTDDFNGIVLPNLPMYIADIRRYMPHAYPFLLLDRITAMHFGQMPSISGYKNITMNEEYFQGHFPQFPIMPGVMIMEALAQLCGVLGMVLLQTLPEQGTGFLFAGMEHVRFRRQVVPGDQLHLDAQLIMNKRGIFKFSAQATVDGKLAAQADIILSHQQLPIS